MPRCTLPVPSLLAAGTVCLLLLCVPIIRPDAPEGGDAPSAAGVRGPRPAPRAAPLTPRAADEPLVAGTGSPLRATPAGAGVDPGPPPGAGGPGGGGGGGGGGAGAEPEVPLLVSEALPPGVPGLDRVPGVATFGLPFAEGQVPELAGRPALDVDGADVFQFRTLASWPDGTVRWALCDAQLELAADQTDASLTIVPGSGASTQPPVASMEAGLIVLDTGPLRAWVRPGAFNLLDRVVVDGVEFVASGASPGVVGQRADGALLVADPVGTTVVVEENGPARAVVRADGELVSVPEGMPAVDVTCRIVARRGSRDVEVTVTVRNADLARPEHLEIQGIEAALVVDVGPQIEATYAGADAETSLSLGPAEWSYLYQAHSTAPVTDVGPSGYKPHVPKLEGGGFAQEGYTIVRNGSPVVPLGSPSSYPGHGYARAAGAKGAVTVALRHMPRQWPAAIEVWGNGLVSAGLFSQRNAAPYVFVWRQHESRTAVFSFAGGAAPPPARDVARRLDAPIVGRAADFAHYDAAGVLPYRLLTIEQQDLAYELMGLQAAVSPPSEPFLLRRYLQAAGGGGENNHANIERRLGLWLRHGDGGAYQRALSDALYKAEWQIERSDGWDHADDPGASNDVEQGEMPFYTIGHQGDDSHRYRDGMILASYLTGDPRFAEALGDEVEILVAEPYEADFTRPVAMTLRALALLHAYDGDPLLRQRLEERLVQTNELLLSEDETAGWEAPPAQGARGYYAHESEVPEAPEVKYATRGFFAASLMPLGLYHAARELGPATPEGLAAAARVFDLARYTRNELFPFFADPDDRRLVYAYDIGALEVLSFETFDAHPILLPMGVAWELTGDASFLDKGVEQLEAWQAHGTLDDLESRFDVQHFLHAWLTSQAADEAP